MVHQHEDFAILEEPQEQKQQNQSRMHVVGGEQDKAICVHKLKNVEEVEKQETPSLRKLGHHLVHQNPDIKPSFLQVFDYLKVVSFPSSLWIVIKMRDIKNRRKLQISLTVDIHFNTSTW
jgi:hypothetical protein